MNHMFTALYDIFTNIFFSSVVRWSFTASVCRRLLSLVTLHVKIYISEAEFHEWKSTLYYGYIICHHHCSRHAALDTTKLNSVMMMTIIALQTSHASSFRRTFLDWFKDEPLTDYSCQVVFNRFAFFFLFRVENTRQSARKYSNGERDHLKDCWHFRKGIIDSNSLPFKGCQKQCVLCSTRVTG